MEKYYSGFRIFLLARSSHTNILSQSEKYGTIEKIISNTKRKAVK